MSLYFFGILSLLDHFWHVHLHVLDRNLLKYFVDRTCNSSKAILIVCSFFVRPKTHSGSMILKKIPVETTWSAFFIDIWCPFGIVVSLCHDIFCPNPVIYEHSAKKGRLNCNYLQHRWRRGWSKVQDEWEIWKAGKIASLRGENSYRQS